MVDFIYFHVICVSGSTDVFMINCKLTNSQRKSTISKAFNRSDFIEIILGIKM